MPSMTCETVEHAHDVQIGSPLLMTYIPAARGFDGIWLAGLLMFKSSKGKSMLGSRPKGVRHAWQKLVKAKDISQRVTGYICWNEIT